jgi:hypothetical protein
MQMALKTPVNRSGRRGGLYKYFELYRHQHKCADGEGPYFEDNNILSCVECNSVYSQH